MSTLPSTFRRFGVKTVVVLPPGADDGFTVEAHIQPDLGFFPSDTPIYAGYAVDVPDPRGGSSRKRVESVKVYDIGAPQLHHIEVRWGERRQVPVEGPTRLTVESLHPAVLTASGALFADRHYSQAVFEATKALELRVKTVSGLDKTGRDLMQAAFGGDQPPIDVRVEQGRSGMDEQEGFRFIFMGVVQGIRNPKGHELVEQKDPQRTLEYLGLVSLLFRRLDDATKG